MMQRLLRNCVARGRSSLQKSICIGTDTVNSIRSPASANSIVGIRPTLGLVSRAGVIPYSFTQDAAGPLARTVSDATKMLNVLVGYDPNDPVTAWSVGNVEKDYTKFLKADGVKGKRIGVLRSFFGNAPVNDEVNIIANQAVEDLRRLGAQAFPPLSSPADFPRQPRRPRPASRWASNSSADLGPRRC